MPTITLVPAAAVWEECSITEKYCHRFKNNQGFYLYGQVSAIACGRLARRILPGQENFIYYHRRMVYGNTRYLLFWRLAGESGYWPACLKNNKKR